MSTEIEQDSLTEVMDEAVEPEARTIFAKGARLAVLRFSQYGVLFLVGVITSRALGPELRGQFALAATLGGVGFAIFNLSLHEAAGRLVAHRRIGFAQAGRLLVAGGIVLGLVGAAAVLAFGLATRGSLLNDLPVDLIVLGALLVPAVTLQHFGSSLLIREGDLTGYGWISLGAAVVQLVAVAALAIGELTPEAALGASIAGSLVGALALWLRIPGQAPTGDVAVGGPPLGALTTTAFRIHGASLGIAMMLGVDIILVAAFEDDRSVGLYSLAAALANLVFLGVSVISQAALHTQTVAEEEGAADFTADFVRLSWIASIGVATIVAVFAYPLIRVVYGTDFTGSVVSLIILAFAAVAFAIEAPLRAFLFRARGPGVVSAIAGAGLILNIALNVMLIPALGIAGAALASLIAYWLYAAVLLVRFRVVAAIPYRRVLRFRTTDIRAVLQR